MQSNVLQRKVYFTFILKNAIPEKFKFYSVVIILVFLDVIILIVLSLKDPLRKKALKLTSELLEKEDIINEPEIEICKCNNEIVWIGIEL